MYKVRLVRRSRLARAAALIAVIALLVASCGDDDDAASDATQPSEAASPEELTVTIPITFGLFYPIYYAQQVGYFEDENLSVDTIDNAGGNTLNLLASGQADLAFLGAGGPLLASHAGKPMTIVYAISGGGTGVLVGAKDITSVEQLEGQRVAALPEGTGTYGYAVRFQETAGVTYEVVPMADAPTTVAALTGGSVEGWVGAYQAVAALVESGEANLLIDTRDVAVRREFVGPEFPEGVVFGDAEVVRNRGEAVTRFLTALNRAIEDFYEMPAEEIAETLSSHSAMADLAIDRIIFEVEDAQTYRVRGGYIDEEMWSEGLSQYETWGMANFDPAAEVFSYGERVDMTYLEAAGVDG